MATMGSLHQHVLYASKPKASSHGATRRDISVKINTGRVRVLQGRRVSSFPSLVVKCSAPFRSPEGQDDNEGQVRKQLKGFGTTDFATSLLKSYFPLSAVLGDVLCPEEKINHVLSSYEDKLEKLKVIESTLGVKIGGDRGGEHDYLANLDLVEQLIYQGKFEVAKQYCENHILPEASLFDHRPRFYLVVAQVMLMLDLAEKTSEYWKEIVDSYVTFPVPITGPGEDEGPDEDAGPMPSHVEEGAEDRLVLLLELMKIFKQAISGGGNNTDYLQNLSPPFQKP